MEDLRNRIKKATAYMVIGIAIGYIAGFIVGTRINVPQALSKDPSRIALSGYYTAILENKEYCDEEGNIWVLDSKVTDIYR